MGKTLSPKDKRKLRAYKLKYKQGMDNGEIAEEIGRAKSTVETYFSEKEREEFKELFDPEEIEFMRFQTMREIKESKSLSKDYISRAIQQDDVDGHVLLRAAKQERQAVKDFISMMQEINVFEKPTEKKEHEHNTGDVTFNEEIITERMEEAQKELEEAEQNVKQD